VWKRHEYRERNEEDADSQRPGSPLPQLIERMADDIVHREL